jgi:hypothetical protein
MKKQILTYIIVVFVAIGAIAGGFYGYQVLTTKKSEPVIATSNCETSNNGRTITYKGEDNSTALELLNKKCQTESTGQGESSFITKINGVEANSSKEFWSFKVNGEMASVGAGSYTTKSSDIITWELSTF